MVGCWIEREGGVEPPQSKRGGGIRQVCVWSGSETTRLGDSIFWGGGIVNSSMKMTSILTFATILGASMIAAHAVEASNIPSIEASSGILVFAVRDIPAGVPERGAWQEALRNTVTGSRLFSPRQKEPSSRFQNAVSDYMTMLKMTSCSSGPPMEGKTWGPEIVAFEDGMNSINDPLTVQLADGRMMMMFGRFPYGRHSRASGWIKMAETGYDNPKLNILTYLTFSNDDGLTWTKPKDISRAVKSPHWLNANSPGALIQLKKGKHKGRIIASIWGTVPVKGKDGKVGRSWEIVAVYSDDNAKTWKRTPSLKDPEKGYPNECQIAEASNGDLVIVSRNQAGCQAS